MEIIVGDISCTVVNPRNNTKALIVIRDVCKARPSGFQYMPRYRMGAWDGYLSLMHSFSKFPTGLLYLVLDRLAEAGYKHIALQYNTQFVSHVPVTEDFLHGVILRDYQVDAANVLLDQQRGVARMATNSGKTEVMAAIIKALRSPTIVVLHRKELLYQTAERFKERLKGSGLGNIGLIGDGIWDPSLITVAMVQTLHNNMDRLWSEGNVLVIVDECHNISSDQMLDVFTSIPGPYRYGFSGTPLKYDKLSDMKLVAATGDIVYDLDNAYLIGEGYSATPIIRISTIEDMSEEHWDLSYQDAYSQLIVNNDTRNAKIVQSVQKSGGTVLILVNRVEHGKILHEMIPESVFVHGSDSTEYRKSVLEDMRAGNGVFIASPIFDEGIDVPAVDCVIMAGAGKSHIKLLQRIGRGMRHKDGNNSLIVYDFIDDNNKYLLRHSEKRIDTYVSEGFNTELV
jgi:superfamily II DNA or RNA helicase